MSEEPDDEKDFSWSDSASVVVKSTAGIAVYSNPSNDVVIRQDRLDDVFWDKDPFIVIPRERLADVIAALKREAEDDNG